jgi:hypothetical protein
MADLKISQLTGATTPLAGTEVLPIVQSSSTKKVTVADLTTGRAISATQLTLTTGNLIVANGNGIDFSATPGTGTSELLNDYEEGTWTPTITSGTGSITSYTATGAYTKIGRVVTIAVTVTIDDAGTASGTMKYTLPFTQVSTPFFTAPVREYNATGVWYFTEIDNSGGTIWTSINGGVVWSNTYNYTWSITYFTT